jgi:hypothetical protein
VFVCVGVFVDVFVGVFVGVFVDVIVGVGVGVGQGFTDKQDTQLNSPSTGGYTGCESSHTIVAGIVVIVRT